MADKFFIPEKYSLKRLVECGLLTQAELGCIRGAGIKDGPGLVAAWRKPAEQRRLESETGLSRDQLKKATLAANLLSLEGPGAVTAEKQVMSIPWQKLPELPEDWHVFPDVAAPRAELVDRMARDAIAQTEKEQFSFRNSYFVKSIIFALPLLVVALGLGAFSFRDELSRYLLTQMPADLPAQWDWEANRLLLGGLGLLLVLLQAGLTVVMTLFSDLLLPRLNRLVNFWGGVNIRFRLVLNDAELLLSPRELRVMLAIRFYPLLALAYPGLIIAFQLAGGPVDYRLIGQIMAWTVTTGLTVMLSLGILMQHRALKNQSRKSQPWYEQARPAQLGVLLARLDLVLILLFTGLLALALWMKAGAGLLTGGLEGALLALQNSYLAKISQQAADPQTQAALRQALSQYFEGLQPTLHLFTTGVDAVVADFGRLMVWNLYILGMVFSVLVYFLINAKKGLVGMFFSLGGTIGLWLVDQVLPQSIAGWQATGVFELQLFTLTAFAIMFAWQMNRDILNTVGSHRDDRECPGCFVLIPKKARFCESCGQAVIPLE